jgi:hypothetical protein
MSETLFEGYEPEVAEDVSHLSAGQRLTLRQAGYVAAGIHPLTRAPIHPLASRHRDASAPKDDPFTCGSCYFRHVEKYHDKSYPKCLLPSAAGADQPARVIYPRVTNGPASDVRAWWPACRDYSPGSAMSPDAARNIPNPAPNEHRVTTEEEA